jgi:CubicO group peptidase (beta-lactamase class C family)
MIVVVLVSCSMAGLPARAEAGCDAPTAEWTRRSPAELGFDAAKLQDALDWANTHTSATVKVFRYGCLAAESRLDALTSDTQFDAWSVTKSVTSMVVGRAVTLGRFDIDAPIGDLFAEADPAHAALTPRHLLTMSSGLHLNWVRDLNPFMPDRARDALSLPFDHEPGTWWEYHQSPVNLLTAALGRALGEDVQDFAQRELFGPLGIPAGAWTWDRDRAGNTEGWAHLHVRSEDLGRLGELILRRGIWDGTQLISEDYVTQATSPSAANGSYGLLFWLNTGGHYVMPAVQGHDEGTGKIIASAPTGTIVMAGNNEQRVHVIPSLDLVVVRMGHNGSFEPDTRKSVWTSNAGELDYELLRRVQLALTDTAYDDPGPYAGSDPNPPPVDDGVVGDAFDPEHVLAGAGLGPRAPEGCTPLGCS